MNKEKTLQAIDAFVDEFGYWDSDLFRDRYTGKFESWDDFLLHYLRIEDSLPKNKIVDFNVYGSKLKELYTERNGFVFFLH